MKIGCRSSSRSCSTRSSARQAERIERIEKLAGGAGAAGEGGPEKAKRAARLAKADLLTEVVGEFPEVQGLMGKYYAQAQREDEVVARAIEEHYKPLGPGDRVPTDPVSIAVALADKLDMLTSFWAIDEKPTGSRTLMRCDARRSASFGWCSTTIIRHHCDLSATATWIDGIAVQWHCAQADRLATIGR